ncbi:hypothetical protein [Psychromicrobium lacuslunae]|uniref:Uncharacterized protein n=1 Tax=Psychromicrobium lacuslunae TaxID=1618207 RepID=A0A0D4BXH7_9MICC|nr:hypothetical protein [Psychromicrobium lacuslunae]AJT40840.1 hypothetical protein UM93_03710 [Psychromicrobium lacuslunae]
MIPQEWISVIRPEDREVVGYLEMFEDGFVPYDLLGRAVPVEGAPEESNQANFAPQPRLLDYQDAEDLLIERGLSYLAARWKLEVDDAAEPVDVIIREITPAAVLLMVDDYDYAQPLGTVISLDLPERSGRLQQGSDSGPRFLKAIPN